MSVEAILALILTALGFGWLKWRGWDFEALAAIFTGLVWGGSWIVRWVRRRRSADDDPDRVKIFRHGSYRCRAACAADVDELYDTFRAAYGNDLLPLSALRGIHHKCPHAVQVIAKTDHGYSKHNLVGYFELFPLTSQAVERVRNGQIDGRSITESSVNARFYGCRRFYLGSVGVCPADNLTREIKAAVVYHLREKVRHMSYYHDVEILTRPVTESGLGLARKFGFKAGNGAMPEMNEICSRLLRKGDGETI